jgi:hypothetical protein
MVTLLHRHSRQSAKTDISMNAMCLWVQEQAQHKKQWPLPGQDRTVDNW